MVRVQVKVNAEEGGKGDELVEMQEGLVECVPDWRRAVETEENHRDSSNQPPGEERDVADTLQHVCEILLIAGVDGPGHGVGDALQHNDPTQPSVEEIVRVEADTQERDERVIAASQDEKRDHVQDGERARPASKFGKQCRLGVDRVIQVAAVGDLASHVQDDQNRLESGRNGAHVDGRGELDLSVVSLAPQRGVENVFLDVGPYP